MLAYQDSLTLRRRLAEYTAAQAEAAEEPKENKPISNGTHGSDRIEDHAPKQEPLLQPVANADANSRKRKADDALDTSEIPNSKKSKIASPSHPQGLFRCF